MLNVAITRFFIVAIVAAISSGLEKYYFTICAAEVTRKLRILSFRTLLRQDSELFQARVIRRHTHLGPVQFFDREENNVSLILSKIPLLMAY